MTISLATLTTAALVNGLNPCGIGMMITFLGYLLVFGEVDRKKKQLLTQGIVYVVSVFVTYLFIGLLFYSLAFYLQRLWIASVFKYLVGGAVFLAGVIQLVDGIWPDSPIHPPMPEPPPKKIKHII